MTQFKSIEEWLSSNPSKEQVEKILKVINRGQTSSLRSDLNKAEDKLRKLKSSLVPLVKIGFPIPKELNDEIELTQKTIDELRPLVPVITVKKKKGEKK